MLQNLKIIALAKSKLKKYLKDKEILDIVLFGSAVKGKAVPEDIDIAIIAKKDIISAIKSFHISILKPEDFFINPPTIINTLLREGYSLKYNRSFAQNYRFNNKVLFKYELAALTASERVRIVNILRGKARKKGLVEENLGEWLVNQVFLVPVETEHIFEKFLINSKAKFKKIYVLMH